MDKMEESKSLVQEEESKKESILKFLIEVNTQKIYNRIRSEVRGDEYNDEEDFDIREEITKIKEKCKQNKKNNKKQKHPTLALGRISSSKTRWITSCKNQTDKNLEMKLYFVGFRHLESACPMTLP